MAPRGAIPASRMDQAATRTSTVAPLAAFVEELRRTERFQALVAHAADPRTRLGAGAAARPRRAPRASSGARSLVLLPEDADARDAAEGAVVVHGDGTRVALLPSRGVTHESGLVPPPHLVGERYRALDVLAAGGLVCASVAALVGRAPAARRATRRARAPRRRRAGDRRARRGARARRATSASTGSTSAASSPSAAASSTSSRPPAASRSGSSSSATRSSRSAPSRRSRSARCTRPTTRSSIRRPSGVSTCSTSTSGRRRTTAGGRRGPGRPRALRSTGAPDFVWQPDDVRRVAEEEGLAPIAAGRRDRARPVPAGAAARVRGAAAGDRRARPRRGGERARRVRPLGEPRRRGVRAPRRGRARRRRSCGRSRRRCSRRARRSPPTPRCASRSRRRAAGSSGASSVSCCCRTRRSSASDPHGRQAARQGARELRRPAGRRLRRPRGPRHRQAARLRDEGGGRCHARLPLSRPSAARTGSTSRTSS